MFDPEVLLINVCSLLPFSRESSSSEIFSLTILDDVATAPLWKSAQTCELGWNCVTVSKHSIVKSVEGIQ